MPSQVSSDRVLNCVIAYNVRAQQVSQTKTLESHVILCVQNTDTEP